MSAFTIPEQYVNSDKPIPLFEIKGVEVGVPLLPSDLAETWADKAREVDKHNFAIQYLGEDFDKALVARSKAKPANRVKRTTELHEILAAIRKAQAAKHAIVKDCLDHYPGIEEKLLLKATMPQRHFAFELLRAHNDPFVASTSLQEAAQMALLKRLSEVGTASKPNGSENSAIPSKTPVSSTETAS